MPMHPKRIAVQNTKVAAWKKARQQRHVGVGFPSSFLLIAIMALVTA
jgi:hypothetical protein